MITENLNNGPAGISSDIWIGNILPCLPRSDYAKMRLVNKSSFNVLVNSEEACKVHAKTLNITLPENFSYKNCFHLQLKFGKLSILRNTNSGNLLLGETGKYPHIGVAMFNKWGYLISDIENILISTFGYKINEKQMLQWYKSESDLDEKTREEVVPKLTRLSVPDRFPLKYLINKKEGDKLTLKICNRFFHLICTQDTNVDKSDLIENVIFYPNSSKYVWRNNLDKDKFEDMVYYIINSSFTIHPMDDFRNDLVIDESFNGSYVDLDADKDFQSFLKTDYKNLYI